MKQIVCNTKFKLDPFGDGGSKRSVQIRDFLSDNALVFVEDVFALPKGMPNKQLVRWALRAMRFIRKHYPKSRIRSVSDYTRLVKYYALRIPVVYDKYLNQDVAFFWENTNDRDMVYLLKDTGCPVIGFPHNLESLVSNHDVEALREEVSCLQQCDYVFAISKEETWLLRLLGLKAYYYPYIPPKEVELFLLSIRGRRETRKANDRKRFLLLGSASNEPTREGMQALVDYAAEGCWPFDLQVAGYQTESLRKPKESNITFNGTVSNSQLEQILLDTDAVLVYQPPTTGALTRIPELLLAGIPVFVNFNAARSYHNLDDVHVYESFDGLFVDLQKFVPCQAQPIQKDSVAENRILELLN